MPSEFSSGRPAPLRRDAVANRKRILQSARELFETFDLNATLNDIAHHAGVGVATAYRHFRNRDDVVDALWNEYLGRLEEVAARALEEEDVWTGFVRFMEDAIALTASDRGLWSILRSDVNKPRQIETLQTRVGFAMPEIAKRAIAAGVLRSDLEPSDLSVISVIIGSVADFADAARRDVWRRYIALLLDGLRSQAAEGQHLKVAALSAEELRLAMETWRPSKRRSPHRGSPQTGGPRARICRPSGELT